jgi:hypothetical protein
MPGEVTPERVTILHQADAIWEAFAVLAPG